MAEMRRGVNLVTAHIRLVLTGAEAVQDLDGLGFGFHPEILL